MYGARQLATEQPQLHYATTGAHGSLRCHRVATLSARPVLPRCRTGSIGADRHRPAQPTEQETATPTGAVRRSRRPAEQPIKQLYDATRPTRQPVSFLRCLPVVCRVRVLLCHAWDRVDRSRPTPTSIAGGAGDVHANRSSAPQHAAGRAERATQHAAGDAGGDSCEQRVGGRWLTRR
jgi:hypothetical protein